MIRRTVVMAIVGLVALGVGLIGNALATTASLFTAETARGPLVDRPLDVNWRFGPENRVKLQTQGPVEIAAQRIVIQPGGTLGWHSHPGPTVVTILRGTMSFYHAGTAPWRSSTRRDSRSRTCPTRSTWRGTRARSSWWSMRPTSCRRGRRRWRFDRPAVSGPRVSPVGHHERRGADRRPARPAPKGASP